VSQDISELDDSYIGVCSVCGSDEVFVREHRSLREGYRCPACGSSNRYRGQADALLHVYGAEFTSVRELAVSDRFAQLRIYEPGMSSPFRRYCSHIADYATSFYWPDVAPGASRNGMRCQNLEALTFPDESFDLLISSDIFEHVRRPWVAFEEAHRVLARNGVHVFSIPAQEPLRERTRYRVDTTGDDDVLLDEAVYHGNGAGGRSLVYVDYGRDIVDHLAKIGFDLELRQPVVGTPTSMRLMTFIARKR
jgi:DNA-directed RNA polymerase subunit RPC12/RpoP